MYTNPVPASTVQPLNMQNYEAPAFSESTGPEGF